MGRSLVVVALLVLAGTLCAAIPVAKHVTRAKPAKLVRTIPAHEPIAAVPVMRFAEVDPQSTATTADGCEAGFECPPAIPDLQCCPGRKACCRGPCLVEQGLLTCPGTIKDTVPSLQKINGTTFAFECKPGFICPSHIANPVCCKDGEHCCPHKCLDDKSPLQCGLSPAQEAMWARINKAKEDVDKALNEAKEVENAAEAHGDVSTAQEAAVLAHQAGYSDKELASMDIVNNEGITVKPAPCRTPTCPDNNDEPGLPPVPPVVLPSGKDAAIGGPAPIAAASGPGSSTSGPAPIDLTSPIPPPSSPLVPAKLSVSGKR